MPNLSLLLSALALNSVAGTQLFDFRSLVDIEGTIAIGAHDVMMNATIYMC
jgi:hypothetical protein